MRTYRPTEGYSTIYNIYSGKKSHHYDLCDNEHTGRLSLLGNVSNYHKIGSEHFNLPGCLLSARTRQAEGSPWSHMGTSPCDPEPQSGPAVGSQTAVALDQTTKYSMVRKLKRIIHIQRFHATMFCWLRDWDVTNATTRSHSSGKGRRWSQDE